MAELLKGKPLIEGNNDIEMIFNIFNLRGSFYNLD
jgi:hypothetical protein